MSRRPFLPLLSETLLVASYRRGPRFSALAVYVLDATHPHPGKRLWNQSSPGISSTSDSAGGVIEHTGPAHVFSKSKMPQDDSDTAGRSGGDT